MDSLSSIVRFIQDGGAFMYPILFTLALGLSIAIERMIYLSAIKRSNKKAWLAIYPLIRDDKISDCLALLSKSKTMLSRILEEALMHLHQGRSVSDVERILEEGFMEHTPRLEKRTAYLATFANIATLLGLLGTILGLIAAFSAVANADPAEKANLLSSSISVAMNTTAFGLVAAIPLLLLHALLTTKTTQIIDSLDMATVKIANLIQLKHGREVISVLPQALAAAPQQAPQAAEAPKPAPKPKPRKRMLVGKQEETASVE